MDASPIVAELQGAGYPSRTFPGYPSGEAHAIYFLPDGDVHLATQSGASNRLALISTPFFVLTGRSVEKRISIWEQQFLPGK